MADDWRVKVVMEGEGHMPWSPDRLASRELAGDVGDELGDRVAVSRDGGELFLYADGEAAARAAEQVVRADLAEHGWQATVELTRWHDDADRWEPADAPLPSTEAERAAEHEELIESEDQETAAAGEATWEVRVELPSRGDARTLAERLEGEGLVPVRRWKYLFVGAADEDAANALAERLRGEAPAGSEITAEATFASIERSNPFAIFGAGTGDV
jgi:hypothetical protein